MRDLNKIAAECMAELDKLQIPYREVEKFVVNTRAKSRWGRCQISSNGKFIISISDRLLMEDADIKGLKNTIIHELLHTCSGCMNHKTKWKFYADKVNREYGYNIKRTSTADEKGVKEVIRRKKINHKYVCKKCGQIVIRERDRGFENKYHCGICGGNFIKKF